MKKTKVRFSPNAGFVKLCPYCQAEMSIFEKDLCWQCGSDLRAADSGKPEPEPGPGEIKPRAYRFQTKGGNTFTVEADDLTAAKVKVFDLLQEMGYVKLLEE